MAYKTHSPPLKIIMAIGICEEVDHDHDSERLSVGTYSRYRSACNHTGSGDSYIKHTDAIIDDCPSTTPDRYFEKIVDDIITYSDTVKGAFKRICSILSHSNKNGLVFIAKKFRFARKEVEFAGFMITKNCMKPAEKYTASINDFPTTSNISEVRAWYGLVNQVAY